MKYEVPAFWMEVTQIGPYRIVPAINAKCPVKRPSLDWLFYRLHKYEAHISDHGTRAGAIHAANRLNGAASPSAE